MDQTFLVEWKVIKIIHMADSAVSMNMGFRKQRNKIERSKSVINNFLSNTDNFAEVTTLAEKLFFKAS